MSRHHRDLFHPGRLPEIVVNGARLAAAVFAYEAFAHEAVQRYRRTS